MCWGKAEVSQEQVTCTSHWDILQTERHHRSLLALSPELIMGDIYCPKRIVSSVETDKQNYSKPSGNSSTCRYRTGWTPMTAKCFLQTHLNGTFVSCALGPATIFAPSLKSEQLKSLFSHSSQKLKQLLKRTEWLTDCTLGMLRVWLRHRSSPLLLDTGKQRWGSVLVPVKTHFICGLFPNGHQHPWGCPWIPEVRL